MFGKDLLMKHTTLLSIYRTVLHDSTISHSDFVTIVDYLKRFNGKADKKLAKKLKLKKLLKKVDKVYEALTEPKKRGRPKGSKNKSSIEPKPKPNHITIKEPFETTAEFKQRLREENGK